MRPRAPLSAGARELLPAKASNTTSKSPENFLANASARLFDHLRTVTAQNHQGLENWIDIDNRFATSEGYRDYLRQLLPLFRGYENSLSQLPWIECGFDFDSRRKVAYLERDLRFFGVKFDPTEEIPFFSPQSLAAGFGCLYVLEGSTLGGRVILERLEKSGIHADSGAAFFQCYGERTGLMWKAFKEEASNYCTGDDQLQEAGAAAIATFDHYRKDILNLQRDRQQCFAKSNLSAARRTYGTGSWIQIQFPAVLQKFRHGPFHR